VEYFLYTFRLDGKERVALWFGGDTDRVLTDEQGRISTFLSVEDAKLFATIRKLSIEQDASPTLELDWISAEAFIGNSLDCVKTLNAWNFFADVANSIPDRASEFLALHKKPNKIYDKLFWGNNLPAVTPDSEHYEPAWSEEELSEIKSFLYSGLDLLRGTLAREDKPASA
jgi:hypothetical protein